MVFRFAFSCLVSLQNGNKVSCSPRPRKFPLRKRSPMFCMWRHTQNDTSLMSRRYSAKARATVDGRGHSPWSTSLGHARLLRVWTIGTIQGWCRGRDIKATERSVCDVGAQDWFYRRKSGGHNFRAKIPVYLLNGGFLAQTTTGIVNLTTISAYKTPCVFWFQ